MECEKVSNTTKTENEYDINNGMNLDNLFMNTYYESKYVFDINQNIFNPKKVSINSFLFKLNRRIQNMEANIHFDTEDSCKHRIRLYNTK